MIALWASLALLSGAAYLHLRKKSAYTAKH